MLRNWFFTFIILGSSFGSLSALEKEEDDAIRNVVSSYIESWNEKGCVGFADGYTEDADFVNIFGMVFSGNEEIENRHTKILQTIFKGSTFELLDLSLREVQAGLVIALVKWRLHGFRKPGSDVTEVREGIITNVFIDQGGRWMITASQNTLIP